MLYVLCVFFVASFIFFEVLDVDGSDFPTRPAKLDVRLADPPHDDIKRTWFHGSLGIWTGHTVVEVRQPEPDRGKTASPSPAEPRREHRAALPRAALSDVPPSA